MIAQEQAILQHEKKYTSEERPTFWYDCTSRIIIFPDGDVKHIGTMPLTSVLGGIEKHMQRPDSEQKYGRHKAVNLFIRAGNLRKNKPNREYFNVGDGWIRDAYEYVDTLFAKYYRDGYRVYVYGTGKYFGEERDIIAIRKAWYTLQSQLDDAFHYPNFKLYTTPASTGRNLLRGSLPENVQYERLPDDILRAIYRDICYQSRIQHFPPKRPVLENGGYIIDGSWFYASFCLNDMPTGKPEHDTVNELATFPNGYRCPGFYYGTATVPLDRPKHIGLLKEWTECYRSDDESRYPNEPGETFKFRATNHEVFLAMVNGYHIVIEERYYFPHKQANPLYNWIRKLIDLREKASTGKGKNSLLKAAYRNIVLHTIGSFKQAYTWKNHTDITDDKFHKLEETGRIIEIYPRKKLGFISCVEELDLPGDRQKFVHPEIAAYIWGMARAKLAEFLLQNIPYEDVVFMSTDCVWAASVPDGVQKKGEWNKPGEFVVKDHIPGPWEVPTDSGKMRDYVIKYNVEHNKFDEIMH